MGDPDLSERVGPPDRPPGLLVFPADSLAPAAAGGRGSRREWWIVVAALVLAALVIGVALLIR